MTRSIAIVALAMVMAFVVGAGLICGPLMWTLSAWTRGAVHDTMSAIVSDVVDKKAVPLSTQVNFSHTGCKKPRIHPLD
jgi:hypothetical protein